MVVVQYQQNQAASQAEKAKRPELASDVSNEDWSYFKCRWTQYKKASLGQGGADQEVCWQSQKSRSCQQLLLKVLQGWL